MGCFWLVRKGPFRVPAISNVQPFYFLLCEMASSAISFGSALPSVTMSYTFHCSRTCTIQQETSTAQYTKRHWLQHNTARDTDCSTIQQVTLTAAQYSKRHWLQHNTPRDTDCSTIHQETLTAAQYSKRHCYTIHQETLTAAQYTKRHWLQHNTPTLHNTARDAAQYSKIHWLLHNTPRDTDCYTIQ